MSNSSAQGNVVAGEASQYISIVPENGEQFVAGQKIIYNIEPEIGYIKKDSYLLFDILNTSTDKNRLCFPHGVGAHALIEDVNIYSKETGVLLESLQNYSEWRIVEHQYMKDSVDQLALKEGVGSKSQSFKYDIGLAAPQKVFSSAGDIENNLLSPVTNNCSAKYSSLRVCIPLCTGLMGAFDSDDRLIPILNFGGLRIEIKLQSTNLAVQHVAAKWNKTSGLNNARDEKVVSIVDDGSTLHSVGLPAGIDDGTTANNQGVFAAGQHVFIRWPAAEGCNVMAPQDLGLAVGNRIRLYNDAANSGARGAVPDGGGGALSTRTITAIENIGNTTLINGHTRHDTIRLTLDGNMTSFTNGAGANTHYFIVQNTASYKVTKTEYRLLQIQPPANIMNQLAQGINYEFTSYDTFLDNIPSASLRHQIPINSVASKAISMFTAVYNNNDGDSIAHQSQIYGIPPEVSLINDVVFFINNRLYPLRSYNPQAKRDKVLTLNELNKALTAIGKTPLSLGSNEFGDLQGYTNKFLISRELAREGFVFDLRNAEPEVRLQFSGTRTGVLRANTFVFSKRIVQTTAQGVQVIY